jgi:hypothetical protein
MRKGGTGEQQHRRSDGEHYAGTNRLAKAATSKPFIHALWIHFDLKEIQACNAILNFVQ